MKIICLSLSADTLTKTDFEEHFPSGVGSLKMTNGGSCKVTIFIWNFKGFPTGGL
jgi:hypothetical protein